MRLVDENFEGTGYEESWSETVTAGNTLDEDSTIPGTPPAGAGSQCLKAILTAGAGNAYAVRIVADTNIAYIRGYVCLSEEGLADGQTINVMALRNSAGSICTRLVVTQAVGGALKAYFQYYSSGAFQNTAQVAISLNTWYRVEYRYDITNMLWEWRVDGVTQHSGSLAAATSTPNRLLAGATHSGSAQSTLYIDLVVWDDTTWPGEEAGGDPEGSLLGGKLIRGGLLKHGVLVGR